MRPLPPWPALSRAEAEAASVAAAWLGLGRGPWRGDVAGTLVEATVRGVGAPRPMPLGAAAARVRGPDGAALVIGSGPLVRGVAQRLLGGPAELPAPRPATWAEEGAWVAAVAIAASQVAPDWEVDVDEGDARPVAMVEVAVTGVVVGTLWCAPLAPRRRRPASLPTWMEVPVEVSVVLASCRLAAAAIASLRTGDALAFEGAAGGLSRPGPRPVRLGVARGEIAARLTVDGRAVRVLGRYSAPMDDALAAELPVEVRVVVARAQVPAAQLLALAPDAVLPLGRPASHEVELWVGPRRMGRGELVDVEGELAVRVVALDA